MEHIALFPGSFDPFTLGHLSLVEAALRLFDRVVIGVGDNRSKNSLLSVSARVKLIEDIYKDNDRVSVCSYDCLTGDFAMQIGATAIVRGIRNTTDFDFERSIEATNRRMFPTLTTVMLVTPDKYAHIASSIVREVFSFGHDISAFMPQGVKLENYIEK